MRTDEQISLRSWALLLALLVAGLVHLRLASAEDGDHADPYYRQAVLRSIEELEVSQQYVYRVPKMYMRAINLWAEDGRRQEQIQACDNLYVWHWVEPRFGLKRRRFRKCPDDWKKEVWDTGQLPARVTERPGFNARLGVICTFFLMQLGIIEGNWRLEQRLPRCSDEWRQVFFGETSQEFMPLMKVSPIMPDRAFRICENGWVMLEFDIGKDGRTKNISVIDSSHRFYERPAKKALKEFIYLPAREEGEFVLSQDVQHKFTYEVEC